MPEMEREKPDYSGLTQEELIKLLKQKDLFISMLSHDLINSFNTLLMFSKKISTDSELPDRYRKGLTLIAKSGERAYSILENLRTWSKYKAGYNAKREPVLDLSALINSVVQIYCDKIEEKALVVCVETDDDLVFESDRSQLFSILRNLISNAVKFTPQAGIVTITNQADTDAVSLLFVNQCNGLTDNEIAHIFAPDSQKKSIGTNGEPGLGFGLMLTKELIENNGGQITCESKPGAGVLFTITFPLTQKK